MMIFLFCSIFRVDQWQVESVTTSVSVNFWTDIATSSLLRQVRCQHSHIRLRRHTFFSIYEDAIVPDGQLLFMRVGV